MADQQISFHPTLAVEAVFEQVKPLQDQLAQIASILEPIGQLSELGNVFEPLRQFGTQIKELAKLLEPMRSFQDQLRQVLNQFGRVLPKPELACHCARTGGDASGQTRASR
jgi:hypothetical protein